MREILHVNVNALRERVEIELADSLADGYRLSIRADASGWYLTVAKMTRSIATGECSGQPKTEPRTLSLNRLCE